MTMNMTADQRRRARSFRLPVASPILEDARLMSYRHPSEYKRLVVTIVLLLSLLAGAFIIDWTLAVVMVIIYIFLILAFQVERWKHVVNAAEVTPEQFPELHRIVQELCERFQMPKVRVFVEFNVFPNAFAFGARQPYIIGLTSGLLENMTLAEVKFVLGHEMGHIKYGHTRRALILGGGDIPLPPPIGWLDFVRSVIVSWLGRAEEMSADRAGIVAIGGINEAAAALSRFSVGYKALDELSIERLAQQRAELRRFPRGFFAYFSYWLAEHPPFIHRLEAMVNFAGLPTQERLAMMEDAPPAI
jgi:Zn-dependent protease with chaperone function